MLFNFWSISNIFSKSIFIESKETKDRQSTQTKQITDLTYVINNLVNETLQLSNKNSNLQNKLVNVTTTFGDKQKQIEAAINGLQNQTSFLITTTNKLERQGNDVHSFTTDFQTTFHHLMNQTERLSWKVDNLEEASHFLLNKSKNLDNLSFQLSAGADYIGTFNCFKVRFNLLIHVLRNFQPDLKFHLSVT